MLNIYFSLLAFLLFHLNGLMANPTSCANSPENIVAGCVNVITGHYYEKNTDLVLKNSASFALNRFYQQLDPIDGTTQGGWYILPERYLILGKEKNEANNNVDIAITGDRQGAFFVFKKPSHSSKNSPYYLSVSCDQENYGLSNTLSGPINGRDSPFNHRLFLKENRVEISQGNGSIRYYKEITSLPSDLFGEEFTAKMRQRIHAPRCFVLDEEHLENGNWLRFYYTQEARISRIEVVNQKKQKVLDWISFDYFFTELRNQMQALVKLTTSQDESISYYFKHLHGHYQLTDFIGGKRNQIRYSYSPNGFLHTKSTLKEGTVIVDYKKDKVMCLKHRILPQEKEELFYTFTYNKNSTDVVAKNHVKTRYITNDLLHLEKILFFDDSQNLASQRQYFWQQNTAHHFLLRGVAQGDSQHIYSLKTFTYDAFGNVEKEFLYGNLTGKNSVILQINNAGILENAKEVDCLSKLYKYTSDGRNLLKEFCDAKNNTIVYEYENFSSCPKKIQTSLRSLHLSYDEDGRCTQLRDSSQFSSWESPLNYEVYFTEDNGFLKKTVVQKWKSTS